MWAINKIAENENSEVYFYNLTAVEQKKHHKNSSNCGIFHKIAEAENNNHDDLDSGNINYLAISVFLVMQLLSAVMFYFLCDTTSFSVTEEVICNNNKFATIVELESSNEKKTMRVKEIKNNINLLGSESSDKISR